MIEQKYKVLDGSSSIEPYELASISPNADIIYVNPVYWQLHQEAQNFILLTLHYFRETGQIYHSDRQVLFTIHERGYDMNRILTVLETLVEMQDQFLQTPGYLTDRQREVLEAQYRLNQRRLENAKNIVLGELAGT